MDQLPCKYISECIAGVINIADVALVHGMLRAGLQLDH